MKSEVQSAVASAVDLVNRNAGQTYVHLRFADDPAEVDFVANAASFAGGRFEFKAGFETYGGSVDELADVRAELIKH